MNTIYQHPEFSKWINGIKDATTKSRLIRRLEKAEKGNMGDVKPVGKNVWEMREFFGKGWRMYYIQRDNVIIVMLGGGDKSTQKDDIRRAITLAKEMED